MTKRMMASLAGAMMIAAPLALGPAAPAQAERVCLPFADMARQLQANFAEAPVAIGLADNGGLIEVFANGDGSTWTMLYVAPNGVSCLVASGENWMTAPKPKLLTGTPL
jgi:CubicO group peptidase (beta-lactamase class C family)